eukprot:jgi/Mesvir1/4937/Mv15927-RA.1
MPFGGEETREAFIVPPPCRPGDSVSLVAPAAPCRPGFLEDGLNTLRRWGLHPILHVPTATPSLASYLSSDDASRAAALQEAFAHPSTTAVICAQGGYGTTRLLHLEGAVLSDGGWIPREHLQRKRFLGFSDITALHCAFSRLVPGLVTFHSPMPGTGLFSKATAASCDAFRASLLYSPVERIWPGQSLDGTWLQKGAAANGPVRGRIVGGNLTLLASLVGTPWFPDLTGAVLFIEDVNENQYKLDRMITQMHLATGGSLLANLAGLVLGGFTYPDEEDLVPEGDFWVRHLGFRKDLPIISKAPFGHCPHNLALPLGAMVELDAASAKPLKLLPMYPESDQTLLQHST